MNDIGKKLMDGENYLAGLPAEVYEFARYIAPGAMGDVTPDQIVMLIAVAQDDLRTGRFILNRLEAHPYMQRHKHEVLKQIKMILPLIDAIAEPWFALEVRSSYYRVFG